MYQPMKWETRYRVLLPLLQHSAGRSAQHLAHYSAAAAPAEVPHGVTVRGPVYMNLLPAPDRTN